MRNKKQIWFDNAGAQQAENYLIKKNMTGNSVSTLRKVMKAYRIAGKVL